MDEQNRVHVHVQGAADTEMSMVTMGVRIAHCNAHWFFRSAAQEVLHCSVEDLYEHYEFALMSTADGDTPVAFLVLDHQVIVTRTQQELVLHLARRVTLAQLGIVDGQHISVRRVQRSRRVVKWDAVLGSHCVLATDRLSLRCVPNFCVRDGEPFTRPRAEVLDSLEQMLARLVRIEEQCTQLISADRVVTLMQMAALPADLSDTAPELLQILLLHCAVCLVGARHHQLGEGNGEVAVPTIEFFVCRVQQPISEQQLAAALQAIAAK